MGKNSGLLPQPASTNTSDISAALAEALRDTEERWLVTKDNLDYGPFTTAAIVEEVRCDRIVPGNVLIDRHTDERCPIQDHPLVGAIVRTAKLDRDYRRRATAEVSHATREKRRSFALYAVLLLGITGLGGGAFIFVSKLSADSKEKHAGVTSLEYGQVTLNLRSADTPRRKGKRPGRSRTKQKHSKDLGDDVDSLDFSKEGGDERLDNNTINTVIRRHGAKLGRCLQTSPEKYAKIHFSVRGADGRVSTVKVNGTKSGGLHRCIDRTMKAMQFPTFDGTRTGAVFDMSL